MDINPNLCAKIISFGSKIVNIVMFDFGHEQKSQSVRQYNFVWFENCKYNHVCISAIQFMVSELNGNFVWLENCKYNHVYE